MIQLDNNQKKAIFSTLIVQAILLIVFLIFGLSVPLPLPEEEGIEVNLGNSKDGMGDIQPEEIASNPSSPSTASYQTVTRPQNVVRERIVTQNDPDAPALKQNDDKKEVANNQPIQEPQPQVNSSAMYNRKKTNGSSGGQGVTGKPGDQGSPNGNPNSDNYLGDGGNGIKVGGKLIGRVKYLKKPPYDSRQEGIVVVEISIDENGNVINVRGGVKGSTTNDKILIQRAEEAAQKSKYSATGEAVKGTITYHFQKN